MAHAGGRPLKFPSTEALQLKIDEYFTITPEDEWTWTGLALYLDTSRETLREYEMKEEYVDLIKKANTKVEHAYEKRGIKNGNAFNIFVLKNFGWKDERSQEHYGKGGKDLFPQPIMDVYKDDGNKENTESNKEN